MRLAHDRERRPQGAQAAHGQARAAGHKLQKLALLGWRERAQGVHELADCRAVGRVAVVRVDRLGKACTQAAFTKK